MSDFGARLREERERLGLNQAEFGKIAEVQKNAQSNYEQGARYPSADYLQRIAEAGVDVLYVLTGQRTAGVLAPDEAALLDNYRHTQEAGKEALRTTSAALAQCDCPERKAK